MYKLLMNSIFAITLAIASSVVISAWGAIVAPDDTVMPCDNKNKKPPCSTDSDSVKTPAPVPTEKDTIIIPRRFPLKNCLIAQRGLGRISVNRALRPHTSC